MNSRSVEVGESGAAFAVIAMNAVCAGQAQDTEELQINSNLANAAIGEL